MKSGEEEQTGAPGNTEEAERDCRMPAEAAQERPPGLSHSPAPARLRGGQAQRRCLQALEGDSQMQHKWLINKHQPSTQRSEHNMQKRQFPLPVAADRGRTLSPPNTGMDMLSLKLLASPLTPQTSPSGVLGSTGPGGGQWAHVPCLCLGPGSRLVLSLQLCSEEKNVRYAQNKHSHRPPG